jgi:hypothetical protein
MPEWLMVHESSAKEASDATSQAASTHVLLWSKNLRIVSIASIVHLNYNGRWFMVSHATAFLRKLAVWGVVSRKQSQPDSDPCLRFATRAASHAYLGSSVATSERENLRISDKKCPVCARYLFG